MYDHMNKRNQPPLNESENQALRKSTIDNVLKKPVVNPPSTKKTDQIMHQTRSALDTRRQKERKEEKNDLKREKKVEKVLKHPHMTRLKTKFNLLWHLMIISKKNLKKMRKREMRSRVCFKQINRIINSSSRK